MTERQVDKFCRCIKNVKKTIRTRPGSTKEQGAIAICTKSVLQKRRRTLRKVVCRKHILKTQPMKGGRLIAGGADTLVFYYPFRFDKPNQTKWFDDPLKTARMMTEYPTPYPEKTKLVSDLIKKYRAVVRMISAYDSEMRIHRTLKHWVSVDYLDKFVQMHTNLWASNGVYKVDIDDTETKVKGKTDLWDEAMERYGTDSDWYGLITRYQNSDIYQLPGLRRVKCLAELLRTIIHIDGKFIHFDLHMGNAAIMRDGTTVIHDFGRAKIRDYLQDYTDHRLSMAWEYNDRVFRNSLTSLYDTSSKDKLRYDQYFFLMEYFLKEKGKSITDFSKWLNVSSYVEGNNESNNKNLIKVRRWRVVEPSSKTMGVYSDTLNYDPVTKTEISTNSKRNTKFYRVDPMYETRYHHIARIFDLLSVLKGFQLGFGSYDAEDTAKKLIQMIHAEIPCANSQDVDKVIRDCITGIYVTEHYKNLKLNYNKLTPEEKKAKTYLESDLEYNILSYDEENEEAEKYWAEKKRLNDDPRMIPYSPVVPVVKPVVPLAEVPFEVSPDTPERPKSLKELDMTLAQVKAEDKIKLPVIPADAPPEVKKAMEDILKASIDPDYIEGHHEQGLNYGSSRRTKKRRVLV